MHWTLPTLTGCISWCSQHTTHCLQPLDVDIFHNFKRSFRKELQQRLAEGVDVTKYDIGLVRRARERSFTVANIKAGFRDTGIAPLDPDLVFRTGKLSPSIAYSSTSKPVVLPMFSRKHRAAVQQVLEIASQTEHILLPQAQLSLEAQMSADDEDEKKDPLSAQFGREEPKATPAALESSSAFSPLAASICHR